MFILVICSVSSEGFYHICFLIDLAFGKWQYFIFSLPLSLCKLMVLGPLICVQSGVPFSILTGVLAVKYSTLCATGVVTSQRIVALTTLGGEFEFCFSTGIIFSSCRLLLANKI